MNHNNGWFVVRSEIPAGVTKGAVCWTITPNVVKDWLYTPVIQTSQVGYHPAQPKEAIIELDSRDSARPEAILYRLTAKGEEKIHGREGGRALPDSLRKLGLFCFPHRPEYL